jgi:hypothetical protein
MILLVSSTELRLDVIRDLKAGGYAASAPKEEDQGDTGYTLYVEDVPDGEQERVLEIARLVDPTVQQQPSA